MPWHIKKHRTQEHELLNKPPRRMLKDNTIPTFFDHNKDKQPIKRRSTLSRNEITQKKAVL